MDTQYPKLDVKATIKKKIVFVDLVAENKDAYNDIPRPIEYLGQGKYHSYGNTKSKDKKKYHFWKFKD